MNYRIEPLLSDQNYFLGYSDLSGLQPDKIDSRSSLQTISVSTIPDHLMLTCRPKIIYQHIHPLSKDIIDR